MGMQGERKVESRVSLQLSAGAIYVMMVQNEVMVMKDIPVFSTELGVASLVLKEIPYRQTAYIHIQDAQPDQADAFVKECLDFCRMAGADHVFATGHPQLERYPLHTVIYRMRGTWGAGQAPEGLLWPVTHETVSQWRKIYNQKMESVDNAVTLAAADEKRILASPGAYFIHRDEELWGIGWIRDDEILAVAAAQPGKGRRVLEALMSAGAGGHFYLEVASTNEKAIRLYESMGFIKIEEKSRWYRVMG